VVSGARGLLHPLLPGASDAAHSPLPQDCPRHQPLGQAGQPQVSQDHNSSRKRLDSCCDGNYSRLKK
jgi:hypothetical protein